jgi:hypothetical protein
LKTSSPRAKKAKAKEDVKLKIILRKKIRVAVRKPTRGPDRATLIFDLLDRPEILVKPIAIKGNGIKNGKETLAPSFLAIK